MPFHHTTSRRRAGAAAAVVAVIASGLVLLVAPPAGAGTAQPTAQIALPATALIGDAVSFTVSFDNAATAGAGYGPYVDLWLPTTGADGAGAEADDGLTFTSADHRGVTADATVVPITDCDGGEVHPLTGEAVQCPPGATSGDQLVVVDLGDGGFSATRAPAVIAVTAQLSPDADLGSPLTVSARAGFRHGDTPTGTEPISQEVATTASVAPRLFDFSVDEIGPDAETVTGQGHPLQLRLAVSVAPGQTVTGLDLRYELPDNFVYLGATPAAAVEPPDTTAPHDPPDNEVTVTFDTVTGTGGSDATAVIDVFVPELDSGGDPVLDPASGEDVTASGVAHALGDWTPVDSRDPGGTENVVGDLTHEMHLRSLATQTGVEVVTDTGPDGPSPGDVLEWTVDFQVSDHFTVGALALTTLLTDGQTLAPDVAPTLAVTDDDDDVAGVVPETALVIDAGGPCGTGTSTLALDLPAAVVALGGTDGVLSGGQTTGSDTAPATGRFTFRTVVADAFACLHDGRPLAAGDQLSGASALEGVLHDNGTQEALDPAVAVDDLGADALTLTAPVAGADLVVTSTRTDNDIVPGEEVSWLVTVLNDGPDPVEHLAVVRDLPEALSDITFTPSEGVFDEATGEWSDLALSPGGSVTLGIAGLVDPTARGEVVASIIVDPVAPVDPAPDDNVVDDRAVLQPVYDLEVTKEALDTFRSGERGRWEIVVTNTGPSSVTRVTVEDTLAPELGFEGIEASSEAWECDLVQRTVRCLFAEPMPAGAEETLILETAVSDDHQGSIRNSATVAAPDETGAPEADLTNNESAATAVLDTQTIDGAGDDDPAAGTDTGGALARTGFGAIPLTVLGLGLLVGGELLRRRRLHAG